MSESCRWTPNDYSPTYEYETDADGVFVRLLHVWSVDPEWHASGIGPAPEDLIGPAHFEEYVRTHAPVPRKASH